MIAEMFAHIGFRYPKFSNDYISAIFYMINQGNFIDIKKFEKPLLLIV